MRNLSRTIVMALVCAFVLPARSQQRPLQHPADPLVSRTYCAADLGQGRIAAGATYGVLFYQLPTDGGTPEKPLRLAPESSRLLLPDSVNDLALQGDSLLVANGPSGLRVVQGIEVGGTPEVSGHLVLPGAAMGLAVHQQFVAVAMGVMGVALLDLSTPESPALIETYDTAGYARQVQFASASPEGTLSMVVANGPGGVALLTVDPGSGKLISSDSILGQGDVRQVLPVAGGLVVSHGTKGVCFYPRRTNGAPVHCYHNQDTVRGLAATDSHLIAGDGGAGLLVIAHISQWGKAVPAAFKYDSGSINRVYHFGQTIVLAADYYGILVFPVASLAGITGEPSQNAPAIPDGSR